MSKPLYYLAQVAYYFFDKGAVLVKGGKIISTGYNHHRTHYDGGDPRRIGRMPISMHAEMHAIFNAIGPLLSQTSLFNPNKDGRHNDKNRGRKNPTNGNPSKQQKNQATPKPKTSSNSRDINSALPPPPSPKAGCYHSRRRDPKVNGSDLYVARITKDLGGGLGNAKPCWRCLQWCKWAGVKRVFHFGSDGSFEVIKVNEARPADGYQTVADTRLLAGLGW